MRLSELKTEFYRKLILAFCALLVATASSGQQNDADRILAQKREIEKQIHSSPEDILVYAKVTGRSGWEKILNDDWPESIESIYKVFQNNLGQIIYVAEIPTSESGDWMLQMEHFFNGKGETIVFEKRISYFNEDCGDGVVTEILTDLYLENFRRLATIRQLRDGNGNPLTDGNCGHPYNWPVEKSRTAKELIALKKLPL